MTDWNGPVDPANERNEWADYLRQTEDERNGWLYEEETLEEDEHEAEERFRTLGDLVHPELVPSFVKLGATVWSWGYGELPGWMDPDGFNALDEDDLHLFEEEGWEVAAAEWGPFRIDFAEFRNQLGLGF